MRAREARAKKPAAEAKKSKEFQCPLCEVMNMFERAGCECLDAFKQTRIEFLKAIRGLLDRRIACLEKGGSKKAEGGGRVRKINIEG